MQIYRAAIIGCGRIGADCNSPETGSSRIASHAEAYTKHQKTELIAVCDLDSDRLRQCKKRWNVPRAYNDLDEMLIKEEIDILSICTPASSHFDILAEALRTEKVLGILMEKPLTLTMQEADAALHLAQNFKTKISVNYIRRFPPIYRQVAEELRQGDLGRIQHINVYYTKGIVNNGSHALDLLKFFFGNPDEVSLLSSNLEPTDDPSPSFRIKFPAGFEAWFCGLKSDFHNIFEIDIIGSEGRLVFRDQGHILDRFPIGDTYIKHGFKQLKPIPDSYPTDLERAVQYALEDLIKSIEIGIEPNCTVEDARTALYLSLDVLSNLRC